MIDKAFIISSIRSGREQLKTFGVDKIGLFGSFAKDHANEESDVDLLIYFEKGKKNLNNLLDAHQFLENLFGRKTELITEDSLTKNFKEIIYKDIVYVGI